MDLSKKGLQGQDGRGSHLSIRAGFRASFSANLLYVIFTPKIALPGGEGGAGKLLGAMGNRIEKLESGHRDTFNQSSLRAPRSLGPARRKPDSARPARTQCALEAELQTSLEMASLALQAKQRAYEVCPPTGVQRPSEPLLLSPAWARGVAAAFARSQLP